MNLKPVFILGLAAKCAFQPSRLIQEAQVLSPARCDVLELNLPRISPGYYTEDLSNLEAPTHHSRAWRRGNFDVMASSSQTQASTFTRRLFSFEGGSPTTATGGILTALKHPDIDSFPDAMNIVAQCMKKQSGNLEVPVSSFSSLEGKQCPAVWNKRDNFNPNLKRFVLNINDAEFNEPSAFVEKELKNIFNIPSQNIISVGSATVDKIPDGLSQLKRKLRHAKRQGFQTEVLIRLNAHGNAAFPGYTEATEEALLENGAKTVFGSLENVERESSLSDRLFSTYLDDARNAYKTGGNKTREAESRAAYKKQQSYLDNKFQEIMAIMRPQKSKLISSVAEGDAQGWVSLGGKSLSPQTFQALLTQHLPKDARGLIWVDACHSGSWLSLDTERLPFVNKLDALD